MKKGIVIFALGHPNYYYMAENLAASLIANGSRDANIQIALLCENKNKIRYTELFDDIIVIDKEKYMVDDKIVFNNATVQVYDLSPYDITMKLDADMIWLNGRPVAKLFEQLKNVDITFSNTGHGWNEKKSEWASESDIKRAYKLKSNHKLYALYGEFLYFKKTKKVEEYFEKVKEIYFNPLVFCEEFANGNMTDELSFQIACMLTKTYPHEDNFTPVYNHFLGLTEYSRIHPYQLPGNFYGYSIGGYITSKWQKSAYDNHAKHYFKQLGLPMPYMACNKNLFLKERAKR